MSAERWRPNWAKGLTAAVDPRIAKMAAARRGRPSWAKGLTAADHPGIARQAATRRGKKRGPYRTRYRTSNGKPIQDVATVEPLTLLSVEARADYAYLLGLYLGDGSIAKSVNRLEIFLDSRQPEIIASCADAMRAVHPRHRVNVRWHNNGDNCKAVSSFAWQWLVLFPQHGPGRKHLRRIELADWQEKIAEAHAVPLLRGLVESDGSRFSRWVNGINYPAYSFSNQSKDILAIFCRTADRVGVHYTFSSPTTISIARRRDVALLDSLWPIKRPANSQR